MMQFFKNESADRQLGEITATLLSFREDMAEMKEAFGGLAQAQQVSANDRRQQQQIVIKRIEAIERTTSGQHAANTGKLDTMAAEISSMREPVAQFVSMRKRFSGILIAIGTAMGVAWTAAQPVYEFVISKLFGH